MYWSACPLHTHVFDRGNPRGLRNSIWVCLLTIVVMILEIGGGYAFNSLALTADGWHFGSHVVVLSLSVIAYIVARRYAGEPRFTFGTWKLEILGGFASALFLFLVAVTLLIESMERFKSPEPIDYNYAIAVSIVGLIISVGSAFLLHEHHIHTRPESACDDATCKARHPDLNLRAAYVHVLADAVVSFLTLFALLCGKFFGLAWLDPLVGLVGVVFIGTWAVRLIYDSGRVLLDAEMDVPLVKEIVTTLENHGLTIMDLHIWRVGREKYACILVVGAESPMNAKDVHTLLAVFPEIAHVTVETRQESPAVLERCKSSFSDLPL